MTRGWDLRCPAGRSVTGHRSRDDVHARAHIDYGVEVCQHVGRAADSGGATASWIRATSPSPLHRHLRALGLTKVRNASGDRCVADGYSHPEATDGEGRLTCLDFPRLVPESLDDQQRALYELISAGPRRRGHNRSASSATMVPSKVRSTPCSCAPSWGRPCGASGRLRYRTETQRCIARGDRPLRAVPVCRGRAGVPRRPERARVGDLRRQGARTPPSWPPTSASSRTACGWPTART